MKEKEVLCPKNMRVEGRHIRADRYTQGLNHGQGEILGQISAGPCAHRLEKKAARL